MKIIAIIFVFLLIAPSYTLAAGYEVKPTITLYGGNGIRANQYGTRDDWEFAKDKFKYNIMPKGANNYLVREERILSYPNRVMTSSGKVYTDGTRLKADREVWHQTVGWASEDFGTITEYDVRWFIDILRTAVYAIDDNGNVVKYKIVETPHKYLSFLSKTTYEPIAVYKQTKVGIKPKNTGFRYDKNGKMLPEEKQTVFSEIIEYDMSGNVTAIYRKNSSDYIDEYDKDGNLKSKHLTRYVPYLQWSEDDGNKGIYTKIENFEPSTK